MLIYLDSNIVIYFIEQPRRWGALAVARLAIALSQNDEIVVSDLTRLECRVMPMRNGDTTLLNQFDAWFASPDLHVVSLSSTVFERATAIRAHQQVRLADALNLAAAVEWNCDLFLTADAILATFPGIKVEVLQ